MSPVPWDDVEALFAEAIEAAPQDRAALLDARCAGRPELRSEVESLLASHSDAGQFLDVPTGPASRPTGLRFRRDETGRLISHYRLVEWIGAGGMGDVFRAEDLALGREAALKLLPGSLDANLRLTLLAEAEASAKLQHPAIATFYEAGEADGETFVAMEFVRGPTLRARLKDGPVPCDQALSITRCLLEALAHAHAAGLLHRDIKPENLILVHSGFAKLVDFGIAVPLHMRTPATASLTGVANVAADSPLAGTVGYLAPEQVSGGRLDARTDVFQAGVLLYEMLTGRAAFGGASPIERLAAVVSGSPDLDALRRVEMPASVSDIVGRALAREPEGRYDSASAFLRDVRAVSEGHPVAAMHTRVAVADFENRSGDERLNWLGSALAESIHADLAAVDNVSVTPRRKVLQELSAHEQRVTGDAVAASLRLGCGWLVTGEIHRAADGTIRLAARLVNVATGHVEATKEVRGRLNTVFTLQRTLAETLAAELSGAILAPPNPARATTVEAYECFTRARLMIEGFGKGSLEDARELLEQAIAIDDRHVASLAGLAATHGLRAIARPMPSDYERAVAYADQALAIEPRNVESLVWKSYALSALGRHPEAENAVRQALAIQPDNTEALYFAAGVALFWKNPPAVGEVLTLLRRAVESDDERGMWWLALGSAHLCLDHPREALYSFSRARRLESAPSRFSTAGAAAYAGETLRRDGRLEEARAAAFAGLEAAERSDHAYRDTFRAHALTVIGRIALDQGDTAGAEAAFHQVLAQARGRPQPRACGHFVVQALSGLTRASRNPEFLHQATRLLESRETFNFAQFYGALDSDTLFELALGAHAVDQHDRATVLLAQARDAGSPRSLPA
jgi:serine/threonine protein kinase/cytochrome c-type biogenesis protein CcmH/NrfG